MSKKILIVEDDQFLRDICREKIKSFGYETDEALDGETALKKIIEGKPDLVLLDIVIPQLDGFEVLKKIRALEDEKVRRTPVFILSNLGQDNDKKRALDMGADDYLVKAHINPGEIAKKVMEYFKN